MFKNHWYLWTEQRFTHLAIRSTVDATQFLSTDGTVRFAVSPAIHCLLVRATLEVTISWPWLLLVTPFALPVAITWPEWANQIWEALKCQFHSLCHFQIVQGNNLLSYEGLCWQRFSTESLFIPSNWVTIWLRNSKGTCYLQREPYLSIDDNLRLCVLHKTPNSHVQQQIQHNRLTTGLSGLGSFPPPIQNWEYMSSSAQSLSSKLLLQF